MSTRAIFSNDYYTSPCALWKSDATTERMPDGTIKYTLGGGLSGLWEYQSRHASLDTQGTISITPFSLFESLI